MTRFSLSKLNPTSASTTDPTVDPTVKYSVKWKETWPRRSTGTLSYRLPDNVTNSFKAGHAEGFPDVFASELESKLKNTQAGKAAIFEILVEDSIRAAIENAKTVDSLSVKFTSVDYWEKGRAEERHTYDFSIGGETPTVTLQERRPPNLTISHRDVYTTAKE